MYNSRRILVIDDEYFVRTTWKHVLNDAGYDVLTAIDGADGLTQFKQAGPEGIALVILDYAMPQMNGDEVFRRLRQIDQGVRVVLHTSSLSDVEVDELIGEGLGHHLPKPCAPAEMLRVVARLAPEGGRRQVSAGTGSAGEWHEQKAS